MPPGGWESLDKRCPNKRCDGVLYGKGLGNTHFAVKCSKKDYEKRGRTKEMTSWLGKQPHRESEDD